MEAKDLCRCFEALIKTGSVSMFTLLNEESNMVMPYITGNNYRYNNCPCCGKEVRRLALTKKEFKRIAYGS